MIGKQLGCDLKKLMAHFHVLLYFAGFSMKEEGGRRKSSKPVSCNIDTIFHDSLMDNAGMSCLQRWRDATLGFINAEISIYMLLLMQGCVYGN
jgi:hypothetical protein